MIAMNMRSDRHSMGWGFQHLPTAKGTKIKFLILVWTSCLTLAESRYSSPSGTTCLTPGLLATLWTYSRKQQLCSVPAAPRLARLQVPSPCLHRQARGVHLVSPCLEFLRLQNDIIALFASHMFPREACYQRHASRLASGFATTDR